MNDLILYFKVDATENLDNYLKFRNDLFKCCKVPPIYENIDKEKGIFNIYIPSIESGLILKGKLKEIEKNYPEFLVK